MTTQPAQKSKHGAYPQGVPFIGVTRGELIESVHAVAACAADPSGTVALELGDVEVPVYLRSAAKPFIAGAIVASGAAERYGFDDRELAVIAASHNGEPFHVECVRGILSKLGRSENDLQCGAHAPTYELAARALVTGGTAFSAIHNNCSGKHAGILALCAMLGADHTTYLERSNPAQQTILAFSARMTGDDENAWPVAVDGCGIPVFATALRRAARAFARFATLEGIAESDARALERVRRAVQAQPAFLAGTGRFDTDLIVATKGTVVGKAGAEGVHGDAWLSGRLGLAMKVIDGNRRATSPAVIALLDRLGALDEAAKAALEPHAAPVIRNVAGRSVGSVMRID
ncbi:MAG: asparaginase [Candidatus Eremiobacteraeota bacterium]|nr:asparaginase [Candidatus Eremiobacteraeota bacterium]